MKRLFAAAYVIARRDYRATVMSKAFIMFILSPLFILAIVGVVLTISLKTESPQAAPKLVVIANAATGQRFVDRYTPLSHTLDHQSFEDVTIIEPRGDARLQARALLADAQTKANAVLIDLPEQPELIGPKASLDALRGGVALAADLARAPAPAALAPAPKLAEQAIDPANSDLKSRREQLGGHAKTLLFWLNMLLAGMMLSNLVEEKSNKIIEILIAAVPVDAVFLGKLVGMLAVSMTIVLAYGLLIGSGYLAFHPPEMTLAPPAIGWPIFIVLGFGYFIMNYLLVGGIFLGLGAQANSPREVQTISMPATMAQVFIFVFASAALGSTHSTIWWGAAIFPLSSPLVMFAEAAQQGAIWPHLLALAWLALWVALIIRFAGARFRRHVLKSGHPKRRVAAPNREQAR
jgi:ABC-2 type transport system permease protein